MRSVGAGLKLTLLPEDQQVPFLVGMYVMLSKAYVPDCRPNEAKTKELEIQHYIVVRWSLRVYEQRCRGLKLTLLPEDQQVSFLVGMYVMLSKAYVPNCRPNEAKAKKLGGFNTTLFPGGPPPQY